MEVLQAPVGLLPEPQGSLGVGYYGPNQPANEQELLLTIQRMLYPPPPVVAVDVETISLKDRTAVGLSVAISEAEALWFSTYPTPAFLMPWHVLSNPKIIRVYHSSIFDLLALANLDADHQPCSD